MESIVKGLGILAILAALSLFVFFGKSCVDANKECRIQVLQECYQAHNQNCAEAATTVCRGLAQ